MTRYHLEIVWLVVLLCPVRHTLVCTYRTGCSLKERSQFIEDPGFIALVVQAFFTYRKRLRLYEVPADEIINKINAPLLRTERIQNEAGWIIHAPVIVGCFSSAPGDLSAHTELVASVRTIALK